MSSLNAAFEGLQQTGVPLVALRDGKPVPAVERDDIGMSFVIPKIAQLLHLSVPDAVNAFFYGLIILSFVIGVFGCFCLNRRPVARCISVFGLAVLSWYCVKIGDVYIIAPCLTMAFVPWLIYSLKKAESSRLFEYLLLFSAVVIGFCHFLRSQSGTGVLLFGIAALVLVYRVSWKRKVVVFAAMVIALSVPFATFKLLERQRDNYVRVHNPDYQLVLNRHPLWHSIYIGLGFVYNPYVPAYKDEIGEAKVKSIDPEVKYVSPEYEKILREEVFKIHNPTFWFNNFSAKLGVILAYFLVFGNIGVLLRILIRRFDAFDAGFAAALAFTALPGVLVVPYKEYLLGFIALAVLGNIYWVGLWLNPAKEKRTAEAPHCLEASLRPSAQ